MWVTGGSAMPGQGRAARDHGITQQYMVLAQVPEEPEKRERKPYFMCRAFLPSLCLTYFQLTGFETSLPPSSPVPASLLIVPEGDCLLCLFFSVSSFSQNTDEGLFLHIG